MLTGVILTRQSDRKQHLLNRNHCFGNTSLNCQCLNPQLSLSDQVNVSHTLDQPPKAANSPCRLCKLFSCCKSQPAPHTLFFSPPVCLDVCEKALLGLGVAPASLLTEQTNFRYVFFNPESCGWHSVNTRLEKSLIPFLVHCALHFTVLVFSLRSLICCQLLYAFKSSSSSLNFTFCCFYADRNPPFSLDLSRNEKGVTTERLRLKEVTEPSFTQLLADSCYQLVSVSLWGSCLCVCLSPARCAGYEPKSQFQTINPISCDTFCYHLLWCIFFHLNWPISLPSLQTQWGWCHAA